MRKSFLVKAATLVLLLVGGGLDDGIPDDRDSDSECEPRLVLAAEAENPPVPTLEEGKAEPRPAKAHPGFAHAVIAFPGFSDPGPGGMLHAGWVHAGGIASLAQALGLPPSQAPPEGNDACSA